MKLLKINEGDIKTQIIEQEKEKQLMEKIDESKAKELVKEEDDEEEEKIESNISKTVSESITKILIVLIMGMIFCIPLLDWAYWIDASFQNYNSLANSLEGLVNRNVGISPLLNNTLFNFINNQYDPAYPILNISYNNLDGATATVFYTNYTINSFIYRAEEVGQILSTGTRVNINFLVLQKNQLESIINLSKTCFICVILIACSMMFEGDAVTLVLQPLDVMTDIIQKVVNDPIGARNLDAMNIIKESKLNLEDGLPIKDPKEVMDKVSNIENENLMKMEIEKDKKHIEILEEHAEIQLVQKSILKISALLAIGFGEAGADIIKSNLKSHKDLDPMMPGIKKTAFVGFCDIRGFPGVNEALKEDSVIFVNRIAEIVHKSCDKFGGATNKNIGDAFLSVWKFPETTPNKEKYEISPSNIYSQVVADKAVLSFLYVIRAIKLSEDILDYSEDQRIKDQFVESHGYKVNMGFGLHYGWTIEGTVGSKYKIDASYLSPNVNIAARLEAASRQYGVTLLISGSVYEFLSTELKNMCREIDRVTVKGSINAIRLFTIDVNISNPKDKSQIKKKKGGVSIKDKIKKFVEKKILYKNYYDKCESLMALNFRTSFFLKNLKSLFEDRMPESFYEKFSYGFENYVGGKWQEASKFFKKCLQINPDDTPTQVLLDYIGEFKNIAPSSWKGFRELTSK